MQILKRLTKGAHEQDRGIWTFSPSTNTVTRVSDKNTPKHHRTRRLAWSKLRLKKLKLFTFMCGSKDIPKACICRTLDLYGLGNLKNTKRTDSAAANVGKKVLPVSEASFSRTTERNERVTAEAKDQVKEDKKKAISRMKELLGLVAAAKTDKRGKFNEQKFHRQGNIRATPEDYQLCSESPKIDFTWDEENQSITSSVYSVISSIASLSKNGQAQIAHSPTHITCRKENWITTDSEFVVLELKTCV